MKLSAILRQVDGRVSTDVNSYRDKLDLLVTTFGDDRILFGSDWPVCRLVSTYGEVVDAAIDAVSDLTPSERRAILGATAARVYGLQTRRPCGAGPST